MITRINERLWEQLHQIPDEVLIDRIYDAVLDIDDILDDPFDYPAKDYRRFFKDLRLELMGVS